MRPTILWAACGAVLLVSSMSEAQSPKQPQADSTPVPQATPPAPDESLSKRLSRTEGVIKPPEGVDPEIRVPAPVPEPNTTPVIPPPGSPGGDQRIQPK